MCLKSEKLEKSCAKMTAETQLNSNVTQLNSQNDTKENCPHEPVKLYREHYRRNRELNQFCRGPISKYRRNLDVCIIRKRWRITTCDEQSKYAISSEWPKKGSVCHRDDIITYQPQLSHPDVIRGKGMSSGWHHEFTQPDDLAGAVISSGWVTDYNA